MRSRPLRRRLPRVGWSGTRWLVPLAFPAALLLAACAQPGTTAGVPSRPLRPPAAAPPGTRSATPAEAGSPTAARPATRSTHSADPGPTPSSASPSIGSPSSSSAPSESTPSESPSDAAPPPRPGRDPFAGRRIVAYYGAPGTGALGILGVGTPAQAWARLDARARAYDAPGRPAARVFELIATVASAGPGSSGLYRNRVGAAAIGPYLQTVRAHGGTLLLDVQPGRADFLDEAEALAPWLLQPDVGLALDPEWRMGPHQVPGKVFGSVDAAEVDAVSAWLEDLTVAHHLPAKLFVVHQFTDSEIRDEDDLADRPHLHEILNADGFGSIAQKESVYGELARRSPYPMGLKLFYRQDTTLLAPARVLALRPVPQLVDYQ